MTQESKDIVGPLTMSFTILFTMANYILNIVYGIEDTELIRGLINQTVMAATIIIWNYSNEELWAFTKLCLRLRSPN